MKFCIESDTLEPKEVRILRDNFELFVKYHGNKVQQNIQCALQFIFPQIVNQLIHYQVRNRNLKKVCMQFNCDCIL